MRKKNDPNSSPKSFQFSVCIAECKEKPLETRLSNFSAKRQNDQKKYHPIWRKKSGVEGKYFSLANSKLQEQTMNVGNK